MHEEAVQWQKEQTGEVERMFLLTATSNLVEE